MVPYFCYIISVFGLQLFLIPTISVYRIISRKRCAPNIELSDDNGSIISSPIDVFNLLNHHFSHVAEELASNIPPPSIDPISLIGVPTCQSIMISPCSVSEVMKIVSSFPLKHGSLSDIPIFVYKQLSSSIAPLIADIFDQSVSCGKFPNVLKLARIVPLHKKESKLNANNYRPISTLSIMSKIFEKIMCSRIQSFLIDKNIISSQQFGFRAGYSTTDAILEFFDFIYRSLDDMNVVVIIFFKSQIILLKLS